MCIRYRVRRASPSCCCCRTSCNALARVYLTRNVKSISKVLNNNKILSSINRRPNGFVVVVVVHGLRRCCCCCRDAGSGTIKQPSLPHRCWFTVVRSVFSNIQLPWPTAGRQRYTHTHARCCQPSSSSSSSSERGPELINGLARARPSLH